MVERSWEQLEQPILEAIGELEDVEPRVSVRDVAQHADIPVERVKIGVRRLLRTDLLEGKELIGDGGQTYEAAGLRLLPKGRQAVGQWPSSDPREALLQLLSERIAVESDPEERGRLEKLRDSAGQVSKGVATSLITALVQQMTGLG